jgi:hypothetical protein
MWSPIASTLTHGVRDAVVVDVNIRMHTHWSGRVGFDRKTARALNGPRNSNTACPVNGPIAVMFAPSRDRSWSTTASADVLNISSEPVEGPDSGGRRCSSLTY